MHHRVPTPLSIPIMACAIAAVLSAPAPAAAQAPKAATKPAPAKPAPATKPWTVARTPDGVPDLQGYWTNNSYTPLERPNGVTKEFYTPEELKLVEKKNASVKEWTGPRSPTLHTTSRNSVWIKPEQVAATCARR